MPHSALWEKPVGWAASGISFSLDQPTDQPASQRANGLQIHQFSSELNQTEIQPQLQPNPNQRQPNPTFNPTLTQPQLECGPAQPQLVQDSCQPNILVQTASVESILAIVFPDFWSRRLACSACGDGRKRSWPLFPLTFGPGGFHQSWPLFSLTFLPSSVPVGNCSSY